MSEARIGILVNTNVPQNKNDFPQRLHLLIVRIILYFCHSFHEVSWGYYLSKSGVDQTYKKLLLRNVTVKDAQKLLSDMATSFSTKSNFIPINWEEVSTLVLSDFDWDVSSTNYLFVFSDSLPTPSEQLTNIFTRLKKDNNVKLAYVDVNRMLGAPQAVTLDMSEISKEFLYIPTSYLTSDIAHLVFKQFFRFYLSGQDSTSQFQEVTFIKDVIVIDDDDDDGDSDVKKWHVSSLGGDIHDSNTILSLTYLYQVSYELCGKHINPGKSYLVFFDQQYSLTCTPFSYAFMVKTQEIAQDSKESHTYVIKHINKTCGVMMLLSDGIDADLVSSFTKPTSKLDKEPYTFPSLHHVSPTDMSITQYVLCFQLTDTRFDTPDIDLMEEIHHFHTLNINDSKTTSDQIKVESTTGVKLEDLIEEETWSSASEEAMAQAMSLAIQRHNVAALVRKYQNDIKLELSSPTKLKAKCGSEYDNEKLIKEHKIQVVLHLLEYCEFSDSADKDTTYKAVWSLLRSLTYLTSPTNMFQFLNNQIVEQFHEDCTELLREIYEEGFLMDLPELLVTDSNSMSSSILSLHGGTAPLYCEDTNTGPSLSPDNTSQSNTALSRKHSWMDPCQLSQSSFSITVPKSKKKKKKTHQDSSKIAALVCSQKQGNSQGSVKLKPNWTSKITSKSTSWTSKVTSKNPLSEDRQSSKRRKLTRKNSVLDTPLKKQVKNPNTAKASRARQRVQVTPQKTHIVQIQESPIRDTGAGRASSFFGSQTQPKSSFLIKDGFKTPTIPAFKLPHSSTEETPNLFNSPESDNLSQHGFTPPGTPKSIRKFVKKLSYSPMRTLFKDSNNIPPNRINNDYIMNFPSEFFAEKENEPFLPTINSLEKFPGTSPVKSFSNAIASALEPIYNADMSTSTHYSEDAQMATFVSSPGKNQGTVNIQSSGGFLKMLESSSLDGQFFGLSDNKKKDSDEESDISVSSSVSAQRSILKSPFHRRQPRRRLNVSFSLENESLCFSDNDSNQDYGNLINLVDGSIKMDGVPDDVFESAIEPQNVVSIENQKIETTPDNSADFYGKRKRLVSSEYDNE